MEEKTTNFEEKKVETEKTEEKFIYKNILKENNKTRVWSLAS